VYVFIHICVQGSDSKLARSLVLYGDEVVPGNNLAYDNKRKIWATYWSFLEFGLGLSCEFLWMSTHAARSAVVHELDGGISALFTDMILQFFNVGGHNMANGIMLEFPDGEQIMFFAKLSTIVADGDALKQIYSIKGSSGNKVCLECKNVLRHMSELAAYAPTYKNSSGQDVKFVTTACDDVRELDCHTDESINMAVLMLADAYPKVSKKEFADLEMIHGINFTPNGLLFSTALWSMPRPISIYMYDWVHVFLVNGVFNLTLGLVMRELAPSVTYQDLHEYLQWWSFPKRLSSRTAEAKDCCCSKRASRHWEQYSFKAGASECLSVYGIICKYLVDVALPVLVDPVKRAAVQCFAYISYVLDLLQLSARGSVQPAQLGKATTDYLRSFKCLFGDDAMLPKHHFALHLPLLLARHGRLVGCFVHERKHKVVKRWAGDDGNAKQVGYEISILREVLQDHVHALDKGSNIPAMDACLVDPKPASNKLASAMRAEVCWAQNITSAKEAYFSRYGKCSVGDVVLADLGGDELRVGEVWHHVGLDDVVASVVSFWDKVDATTWLIRDAPMVIDTQYIRETLVYHIDAERSRVEILPPIHVKP
jgi:hypothetical protein